MKKLIQDNKHNKLEKNLVKITKIVIIVFISFSVLGQFVPFFEGSNSYFYGIASILFIDEGLTVTNPFLEKYETNEFLVENWLRTNENEMTPMSGNGLIALGGIAYFFGGYFALYYLSPILFIILLIVSERIATKFFGKYAGLITLILLSASNLLFRNSIQLHTESLFCLLFVLGTYFIIKFGRTNQIYLVLIASTMFAFSSTIRLTGIILLPIEFLILGILIIKNPSKNKKTLSLVIATIPWIIFLLFFTYGNILTTGEPFVMYGTLNEGYTKFFESSPSSLITFEEKDFENAIQYSKYLLPYVFVGAFNAIDNNFEDILGEHWIGLIPILIISLIFIFSYKSKNKKLEIFVLTLLILGIIWIYGSITSEELGELGVPGRYVLPAFVLSSMMFGYGIEQIFSKFRKKRGIRIKILQLTLVSCLFVIVIISYNFSPAVTIFDQEKNFKNPFDYEREFPLSEKEIKKDSIIVTQVGSRAQEYNLPSFRLITINHSSIDSINLLQNIIKEKDNVYAFKIPYNNGEKNMIQNLIDNNEFVLEEFSETFCKMKLKSEQKSISDEKCINNEPIRKFTKK